MSTTKTSTKARAGFHLYFRPVQVTINGMPGRRNVPERCTCTIKGNHATAPAA